MRAGLSRASLALVAIAFAVLSPAQDPKLSSGSRYIWRIIVDGDVRDLRDQLDGGLDPNERFEDDYTMLLWAAQTDNVEIADLLLKRGARLENSLSDGTNALMLSAAHYRVQMSRFLLRAGIDPDIRNGEGLTALHHCVNWVQTHFVIGNMEPDQTKIIRAIAEHKGNLDIRDREGRSALMLAARFRHLPQLDALIAAGAEVNLKDSKGRTALTFCAGSGKDSDLVKSLLKANATIQFMDALQFSDLQTAADLIEEPGAASTMGADDETTLMRAAQLGEIELVEKLLKKEVPVNAFDSRGLTAMHLALGALPVDWYGGRQWELSGSPGSRASIVSALLARGALVDPVGRKSIYLDMGGEGETPLVWAAELNQLDVMRVLLAAGADPKGKATKEHYRAAPPLVRAAQIGSLEGMELLLKAGAPASYGSPLFQLYSSRRGGGKEPAADTRTAQIKLLLEHGADVDAGDTMDEGKSPLTNVVNKGNVAGARLLLEAGADVNKTHRYTGETPLMLAVRDQNIAMVRLLLEFKADLNRTNKKGESAKSIAESLGYKEIAELLAKQGNSQ
jgi:serine/threonine-protein phosphatase 6 regulatory ankyrin repeat subunit B